MIASSLIMTRGKHEIRFLLEHLANFAILSTCMSDRSQQALIYNRHGDPSEVLRLEATPVPELRQGEVLLRMRAAAIHLGDFRRAHCANATFAGQGRSRKGRYLDHQARGCLVI